MVSVPYRGATFLNSSFDTSSYCTLIVSVPYRGATFLNIWMKQALIYTKVSVPYRGATFLNKIKKVEQPTHEVVSVPYRGATFLNCFYFFCKSIHFMFPSPIGELHFSIGTFVDSMSRIGFRPLSGSYISQ